MADFTVHSLQDFDSKIASTLLSFSPVLPFLWTLSADLHRWAGPDALHRETLPGTEAVPSGIDAGRARNRLVKPPSGPLLVVKDGSRGGLMYLTNVPVSLPRVTV